MFAWASGVGTACGLAVRDYLMENKIPWLGPSSGSRHWVTPPQKYLFNVYPLYLGDAQVLTEYAVTKMGKKKIAVVYQEDDYGKQGLEGTEYVLKKHGMELAAGVPVALSDTDMRPHAMRLRQADADAVLLFVTPGHVARVLGTAKAMNYEPQWMSTTTCGDFPLMIAITKGLYEGVITASFGLADPTGNVGGVEHINNPRLERLAKFKTEIFDEFAAPDERWGYTFNAGIGFVEPLVEAIRRAGRDLTREKLVEELEKMKDFKGLLGRISYGPYDPENPLCRIGQQEIFLQQCTADGGSKILTDWRTTEFIPMSE
jgi:ABC-type branched-subunit amino acid transport system substrate-binding protein